MKNMYNFALNNTCHGSHLNTAPGQVFAFYTIGTQISNSLSGL